MRQGIRAALRAFTGQKPGPTPAGQPVQVNPREDARAAKPGGPPLFTVERLNEVIERAKDDLLHLQHENGHWVFDLEADTTIPSEYVFLQRFLGRDIPPDLKARMALYIRRRQMQDGAWPLYTDGDGNISASIKAYIALKLLGDSPDAHHMERARQYILSQGGAVRANVFTRITLALFGQIPWVTTPAMPVEIMLLPKWFFFHLDKVSYWSRTVIVPLLILNARRPVCQLGPKEAVPELFLEPAEHLTHVDHFSARHPIKNLFILLDRILKRVDPLMPGSSRRKAIRQAEAWTRKRMQGEGGLGAIFPAMANAAMALQVLGYPEDDPDLVRGLRAIEDLLLDRGEESLCQPCVSPVWDTCLTLSALMEAGVSPEDPAVRKAVAWLFDHLITVPGDWSLRSPHLEPAGWAFQYENSFYPDVDDTPMVLMSLIRAGAFQQEAYRDKMLKAVNWVLGMQSSNGGWGAFDIDNNYLYLNNIPFADHGALLDPSTSDLTGRCMEVLSMLGYDRTFPPLEKALRFLRDEQEPFGGWFGRWGVNYLYGTWSVLKGLGRVGEHSSSLYIQRAVAWLKSCQNEDNGWGETCLSYKDQALAGRGESTPSQTAWALLGLMAAGEVRSWAVQRGIHYLLSTQNADGGWDEESFTGTGFPNVFYLRYHGYRQFFPLWALAEYRRLRAGKKTCQDETSLDRPPVSSFPALKP